MHLEPLIPVIMYCFQICVLPADSGSYQSSELDEVSRNWEDSRMHFNRDSTSSKGLLQAENMVHEFIAGFKTHHLPDTSVVLFDLAEEEKARNL